ncbi:MAG TPA: hypothetical protein VEJ63_02535 [Planctomycetota bacterium]|nr:hypothetical protein [Planctomycetota bacterium]
MPADLPLTGGEVLARACTFARRFSHRSYLLYLLSALIMLAGCYLVCSPYLKSFHDRRGLLSLPLVLLVYELLIIGACGWLIRRAPRAPEARTLFWIEVLFLLDLTFTVNACLPLHYLGGAIVATALSCQKMILLQSLAGERIFGRLLIFLFPLMFLIYSCQGLLEIYPAKLAPERQAMTFSVWLALGLSILFIPLALQRGRNDEDAHNAAASGHWWASDGFRRAVVLVFLIGALFQLGWQMWVHSSPVTFMQSAPVVLAILCVLPSFLPKCDPVVISGVRALVIFNLVLIWLFGLSHQAWPARPNSGIMFMISELRITLIFGGVALWLAFLNERHLYLVQISAFLLTLGLLGHDLWTMSLHLRQPGLSVPIALLVPALLWLRYEPSFSRGLLVASAWLWVACHAAERAAGCGAFTEFLRYWPLVALLWSWLAKAPWPLGRFVCTAAIIAHGALGYVAGDVPSTIYYFVGFIVLAGAMGWRRRALLPLLSYAAWPHAPSFTPSATSKSIEFNSGWLLVLLAFTVLAAALWLTKTRVEESDRKEMEL